SDTPALSLPADFGGWIIDLDDLDVSRVSAGDIPPEWGWQGKTSGYIRQQLTDANVQRMLKPAVRDALYEILDWHNWPVDKLEIQLDMAGPKAAQRTLEGAAVGGPMQAILVRARARPVANALQAKHLKDYEALKGIFIKLNELASTPAMGRTMRRMVEPEEVT